MNNVRFRFTDNKSVAYENAVFLSLKKEGEDVYYWQNDYECDFIIQNKAIQVCSFLHDKNKERNKRS